MKRLVLRRALGNRSVAAPMIAVLVLSSVKAEAKKKKGDIEYNETATVLSHTHDGGHFYRIATDRLVYSLSCDKVKHYQMREPQCEVDGHAIAVGDTIRFRIDDGDQVYLPPAEGKMEQELQILSTELKAIPEAPAAAADGSLRGVVAGTTLTAGKNGGVWNAGAPATMAQFNAPTAAPVTSGPVLGLPVTGGAPVMVVPTAPAAGGGVVTGMPVTGGVPVMVVPTAPIAGGISGAPAMGGPHFAGQPDGYVGSGRPRWNAAMRVVSTGNIYELECPDAPCRHDGDDIHPGDALTIRIEGKTAWVWPEGSRFIKKEKFRILKTDSYRLAATQASK